MKKLLKSVLGAALTRSQVLWSATLTFTLGLISPRLLMALDELAAVGTGGGGGMVSFTVGYVKTVLDARFNGGAVPAPLDTLTHMEALADTAFIRYTLRLAKLTESVTGRARTGMTEEELIESFREFGAAMDKRLAEHPDEGFEDRLLFVGLGLNSLKFDVVKGGKV